MPIIPLGGGQGNVQDLLNAGEQVLNGGNNGNNNGTTGGTGDTGDYSSGVSVSIGSGQSYNAVDTKDSLSTYGSDTVSYLNTVNGSEFMSALGSMFETDWVTSSPLATHSETDVYGRLAEMKAAENKQLEETEDALNGTSTLDNFSGDDGINSLIYDASSTGLTSASESASMAYENVSASTAARESLSVFNEQA